jgi:ferredoxin
LRLSIEPERCTGHGRCYVIAPALFVDDERGFGEVLGSGEVPSQGQEAANAAVGGCPEHAVVLDDA